MPSNVLALDVGHKRVGVALARADVRVPVVLPTLDRQTDDFWQRLDTIIHGETVGLIVIGLPRGLDGQETTQTESARTFGRELSDKSGIPIHWQDEALTSVKAEAILDAGGKPYTKAHVDGVAASLILADYLETEGARA